VVALRRRLAPGGGRTASRWWALAVALLVFGLTVVLVAMYPGGIAPFAATTGVARLDRRTGGHPFQHCLDGLSLWLFALTSLLMIVAVLVSWEAIDQQNRPLLPAPFGPGDGMLGRFCRPRHHPLLHLLRIHASSRYSS